MSLKRILVVALFGVLAMAGSITFFTGESWSDFCTADGILVETPPGWEVHRDHANNCEWTLFDDQGRRAPAVFYDDMPIDPPPPVPTSPAQIVGAVVALASLVGIVVTILLPRR